MAGEENKHHFLHQNKVTHQQVGRASEITEGFEDASSYVKNGGRIGRSCERVGWIGESACVVGDERHMADANTQREAAAEGKQTKAEEG